MISKKHSKIIKEFIGLKFTTKIRDYFILKGVTNKDGAAISTEFIGRVLRGEVANEKVETAIWDYMKEETLRRQKEEEEREQLLDVAQELTHA